MVHSFSILGQEICSLLGLYINRNLIRQKMISDFIGCCNIQRKKLALNKIWHQISIKK